MTSNPPKIDNTPRPTMKTLALGDNKKSIDVFGYDSDPYFGHVEDAFEELSNLSKIVKELCSHNCSILDIGANIGVSSIVMGEANPLAKIYAVEPVPSTFSLLTQNIEKNAFRNISAYQLAISDREGDVSFHKSGNSSANHIVNCNHIASDHFANLDIRVQTLTLDRFVKNNNIPNIQFIKIDVEGFEIDVLNGMNEVIKEHSPIVSIEFNTWTMIAFRNINPRDLLDKFFDLMPAVYLYNRDKTYRRLVTQQDKMSFMHDNIFNNGCVDDLIGCADPNKLASLG